MKILNEREDEKTGDFLFDVEYSKEELDIFKEYARQKGKNIDEMTDNDIMQYSLVKILVDQLEREENE